jgi:NAD+--asparagine ADP-ribosyltransferase
MQKQKDINSYKSKMNTEILNLTTDIAGLQKTYEQKCNEKIHIKSKEEEDNDTQSKKVKELSSLIMALDNLEKVFSSRKAETKLKYNYKLFMGSNGDVNRNKTGKDEF